MDLAVRGANKHIRYAKCVKNVLQHIRYAKCCGASRGFAMQNVVLAAPLYVK